MTDQDVLGEYSDMSSDEEDITTNNTVEGYLFEPEYSLEEIQANKERLEQQQQQVEEIDDTESQTRTEDTYWCSCGECEIMPTEVECVCCHEVPQVQVIVDEFDPRPDMAYEGLSTQELQWFDINPTDAADQENQKCITQHPDFNAHINSGVLTTFFLTHKGNWKSFPKPKGPHGTLTNSQLRLVAYRHILEWFLRGQVLGKKNRIPLPACIVTAIRRKYPSDDDEYVGFKWAE